MVLQESLLVWTLDGEVKSSSENGNFQALSCTDEGFRFIYTNLESLCSGINIKKIGCRPVISKESFAVTEQIILEHSHDLCYKSCFHKHTTHSHTTHVHTPLYTHKHTPCAVLLEHKQNLHKNKYLSTGKNEKPSQVRELDQLEWRSERM